MKKYLSFIPFIFLLLSSPVYAGSSPPDFSISPWTLMQHTYNGSTTETDVPNQAQVDANSALVATALQKSGGTLTGTIVGGILSGTDISGANILSPGSTTPRTSAQRAADVINVKDWGATGNGTTDDSAAINAAFNYARTLQSKLPNGLLPGNAPVVKIVFPPGTYLVDSTLNWTGFLTHTMEIDGYGAVIYGKTTGEPIIDALGSQWLIIKGLEIIGDSTATPNVGLQIGRTTTTANGGGGSGFHITDVMFNGYYSLADFYNLNGEGDIFTNDTFTNWIASTSAYAVIEDGINHFGITSQFVTESQPANSNESFEENTFINCAFQGFSNGSNPLWIAGSVQHSYIDSYVAKTSTGGAAVTLYSIPGAVNRDLRMNIHSEGSFSDEFLLSGTSPSQSLINFHYRENGGFAARSIFKLDTGVTSASITGGVIDIASMANNNVVMFNEPSDWTFSGIANVPAGPFWNLPASATQGTVSQGGVIPGNIQAFGTGLTSNSGTVSVSLPSPLNVPSIVSSGGISSLTPLTIGSYNLVSGQTPTLTLSPPTTPGGMVATAIVGSMVCQGVGSPISGGSGYAVGDTLTLVGGTYTSPATFTVNAVGTGGSITPADLTKTSSGSYTVPPTAPLTLAATTGSGTGASFGHGSFGITGVTVTGAGSGYTSSPSITVNLGYGDTLNGANLTVSAVLTNNFSASGGIGSIALNGSGVNITATGSGTIALNGPTNISGALSASTITADDSTSSSQATNGTTPLTNAFRDNAHLTVEDFGAKGACNAPSVDDTAAFNAYASYLRSMTGYHAPIFNLGTDKCYLIRGSVNLTDIPNLVFNGHGSQVIGADAGGVTLDALESPSATFENFYIGTQGNVAVGLQFGRAVSAQSGATNTKVLNVSADGFWTQSVIYDSASEISQFINVHINNRYNGPNEYTLIMDGDAHWPIQSLYASTYNPSNPTVADGLTPNTPLSFNENQIIGGVITNSYGPAMWVSEARGLTVQNPYVNAYFNDSGIQGPALVLYFDSNGSTINDLTWSVHSEGPIGSDIEVEGTNTTPVIHGLTYYNHIEMPVAGGSVLSNASNITMTTITGLNMRIPMALHPGLEVFDNPSNWTVSGQAYLGWFGAWNASTNNVQLEQNGILSYGGTSFPNATLPSSVNVSSISSGIGVASINVTTGGAYPGGTVPTLQISPPTNGGSQATAVVNTVGYTAGDGTVLGANGSGTGYKVNDIVTLNDGKCSTPFSLKVYTVNASGTPTSFASNGQNGLCPASEMAATNIPMSGGSGTGLTMDASNVLWRLFSVSVTSPGSNYTSIPSVVSSQSIYFNQVATLTATLNTNNTLNILNNTSITGNLSASSVTADTSTSSSEASSGTTPLTNAFRDNAHLTVEDFGAKGDCSTDDTAAFNAYSSYLRTLPNFGPLYTKSFNLGHDKCYIIRGSVNLTNFNNLTFEGNGSTIAGFNSAAVLDAIQSTNMTFKNFSIIGDGSNIDAIQIGRALNGFSGAGSILMNNIYIDGNFTEAAIYDRAAEVSTFSGVFANNRNASGAPALILDGDAHYQIISQFASTYNSSNPTQEDALYPYSAMSNNDFQMIGGDLVSYYGSALWVSNSRGATFLNPYVSSGSGSGSTAQPAAILYFHSGDYLSDFYYKVHTEGNFTSDIQVQGEASPVINGLTYRNHIEMAIKGNHIFSLGNGATSATINNLNLDVSSFLNVGSTVFDNSNNWTANGDVFLGQVGPWNGTNFTGKVNQGGFPVYSGSLASNTTLPSTIDVSSINSTNGVASLNINISNSYDTNIPTIIISPPPNGGSQATAIVSTIGAFGGGNVVNGTGTGYKVNDIATLSDGACTNPVPFKILSVNASGTPLTIGLEGTVGSCPASEMLQTAAPTTDSGSGTGLTLNLNNFGWRVLTATVTNPGSGYTAAPSVTFSPSNLTATATAILNANNTLNILSNASVSGTLAASSITADDSTSTTLATGTSTPLSNATRALLHVTVEDFGAKGDCSTDDTSAFNAYVTYLRNITNFQSDYRKVFNLSPNKCYRLNGSVNFTGLNNFTFNGHGATILAGNSGTLATFDATESINMTFENFTLFGQDTLVGIQAARALPNSGGAVDLSVSHVLMDGSFAEADIYARDTESSTFTDDFLTNRNAGPNTYALIMDGDAHWPIVSQYASTYNPSNPTQVDALYPYASMTFNENTFIGGQLVNYSGPAVWVSGTKGLTFINPYVSAYVSSGTGPAMVLYFHSGDITHDLTWKVHSEGHITSDIQIQGSVANPIINGLTYRNHEETITKTGSVFSLGTGVTSLNITGLNLNISGFANLGAEIFDQPLLYTTSGNIELGSNDAWNGINFQGTVDQNGQYSYFGALSPSIALPSTINVNSITSSSGVGSITVPTLGIYSGGSIPSITISPPPNGGSQATATWATVGFAGGGGITYSNDTGTGYKVNDIVTFNDGNCSSPIKLTILSVNGSGTPLTFGSASVVGSCPASEMTQTAIPMSGGSGTGLTLNALSILWHTLTVTVVNPGSGYTTAPSVIPEVSPWTTPVLTAVLNANNTLNILSNTNFSGWNSFSVTDNIATAGTTLATATPLTSVFNIVRTCTTGAVNLSPSIPIGSKVYVYNRCGNVLDIYPDSTSSQIESDGNGNAVSIAPNSDDHFTHVSSTLWMQ